MPTDEITIDTLAQWYCEYYGIEVWKDIDDYKGLYQVSTLGRVRSVERVANNGNRIGRIRKAYVPLNGYPQVCLSNSNKHKTLNIHQLVANAFISNPHDLPQVNHKDEDKTNNCIFNLEWCDAKYNSNWGTNISRSAAARKNDPKRSISVTQLNTDGVLLASFQSAHEAERQTGIHHANILACCLGERKTAGGYVWKYKDEGLN